MTANLARGLVLDACVLGAVALALGYLSRVVMPRPPVGLFVWSDIWVMVALLAVMPFAYARMPVTLAIGMFGLVTFTVLQVTLSPLTNGRVAALLAVAICAADVGAALSGRQTALVVVNGLVVVGLTVGVTNMWAQTGMTAGHVVALAASLTVYDTLATAFTSMTADFIGRMAGLPFAPVLAVQYGPTPTLVGLGDCLMLTVWPLVAMRSYGRAAAAWAVGVDAAVLGGLLAGFLAGVISGTVPLLTPLGPLIIVQYLYWRGRPRTSVSRPVGVRRPTPASV